MANHTISPGQILGHAPNAPQTRAEPPSRPGRQPLVDTTTPGCHNRHVTRDTDTTAHQEAFDHLRAVRAELLEHARTVRQLATERRKLIQALVDEGFSQADVARELGVTRQAIQKMLAC